MESPKETVLPDSPHMILFEACSMFTRVLACMFAESPNVTLFSQSASIYIVTSVNR